MIVKCLCICMPLYVCVFQFKTLFSFMEIKAGIHLQERLASYPPNSIYRQYWNLEISIIVSI